MHRIPSRFAVAFLLAVTAAALSAQSGATAPKAAIGAAGGSRDPSFATIPFDKWVEEGDEAHIRWTTRVLPVELSNHQRLQAVVEALVDGKELARRRGKGYLAMLVQFSDSEHRVYQAHEALDLTMVKEDTGKSTVAFRQAAFVTPGDYQVAIVILDTATGEHSAQSLTLHVNPLKNEPLPDAWRDLPPVEISTVGSSPDDLFLPDITGRLHLPLETRRPVRVEVLVNASPLVLAQPVRVQRVGEPPPPEPPADHSLANLIPALKVLSHTEVRNGSLDVALLDLNTQKVIFQQEAVHELDWARLRPALQQTGPNIIDVHALENRKQNVQFFLSQVSRRIGASGREEAPNGPEPVLIVLSGPMEFGSGENLHPIELGNRPEARVFYIRYHSIPPRPPINAFPDDTRRGRRGSILAPVRGPDVEREPIDSLEHTLKPLQPHLYDVYTPEQFRKALSGIFEEVSRL